jgi:hypothetical protein
LATAEVEDAVVVDAGVTAVAEFGGAVVGAGGGGVACALSGDRLDVANAKKANARTRGDRYEFIGDKFTNGFRCRVGLPLFGDWRESRDIERARLP